MDDFDSLGSEALSAVEVGESALKPRKAISADNAILDKDWIKTAFMVSDEDIGDPDDVKNRYWSSASAKFTDSRLGCNIGINPRPQWTQYSDIPVKGRFKDRNEVSLTSMAGNYGMGRAYSEGQDDPAQRIYMQFGVPKFNSLAAYLSRAFDREQTILARTGRAPDMWYKLAKIAGTALTAMAFPLLTVTVAAGKAIGWLMGRGNSKFFTLKPTMHLYWSMVNVLVNNHAVNVGIFKKIMANEESQRLGRPYELDKEHMAQISAAMPDIFNGLGYFDIYALANKAQRQANAVFSSEFASLDNGSNTDFEGYLKKSYTDDGTVGTYIQTKAGNHTMSSLFNNLLEFGTYYTADKDGDNKQDLDPRADEAGKAGYVESFKKYADALWRDGSQFAVFRVDHTGSISESFGNSTAESELSQKLNGFSSTAREARFSIADGNVLGDIQKSITDAVGNVALGALDGVTLGFAGLIPGLGGSGYVDIPKHWQSSSASLPRGSYTIQLISPYGNSISQMINIWIPFFMLIAGGIPRSTGKQSYTSPFYCQLYDRGRLQSRLAMIESMSVTRGTSHLPFSLAGKVLAIDVSINVVDLSTIMHMPMSSGEIGEVDMTMDEDNIASDYLNVLAGMDIYSQIYPLPRAQLKATKLMLQMKQKFSSPAFHASLFKNSLEDGFLNTISLGSTSVISDALGGFVRGSASTEGGRML